jgi:NAD(P)-dependent dehydrogenase (short-subunit alcohol dehydrogenase family)
MTAKTGQRVIVTAGASGIGRSIVESFVKAGAKVHSCDVDAASLDSLKAAFPGVTTSLADVASAVDVDRLFAEAAKNFGGLDVLVNNAGIAGPTGLVEEITPADWDRTLAVNITGQFLCVRHAVPMLKTAGGGSIINISSVAGRLGYPFRTPYAASKWAVVGFTKSLAMELGEHDIRVNAIQPGIVAGPRIERVFEARAKSQGKTVAEVKQKYLEQISLRKLVTPEDVAAMVMFLCSDAGRNITGQALSVCGNVEGLSAR